MKKAVSVNEFFLSEPAVMATVGAIESMETFLNETEDIQFEPGQQHLAEDFTKLLITYQNLKKQNPTWKRYPVSKKRAEAIASNIEANIDKYLETLRELIFKAHIKISENELRKRGEEKPIPTREWNAYIYYSLYKELLITIYPTIKVYEYKDPDPLKKPRIKNPKQVKKLSPANKTTNVV